MATIDDVNSTLVNVARNLAALAEIFSNAIPVATAATSPVSYPFNNISAATTTSVIGINVARFGLLFHNPGATASIYVYPSTMTAVPGTSSLGGTFVIAPGTSLPFPSTTYANVNGPWSAFAGTGTTQPFTVVEFL